MTMVHERVRHVVGDSELEKTGRDRRRKLQLSRPERSSLTGSGDLTRSYQFDTALRHERGAQHTVVEHQ